MGCSSLEKRLPTWPSLDVSQTSAATPGPWLKAMKTAALQGSHPRFVVVFFLQSTERMFSGNNRNLCKEKKTLPTCVWLEKTLHLYPVGWDWEGKRSLVCRKARLGHRRNQIATHRNIKKESRRKLRIPPRDSYLQHYSPEMIQNDAAIPHLWKSHSSCLPQQPPPCGAAPALLGHQLCLGDPK